MDIYEALKSGATAEDLLQTFHEDLDKASARIAAEEKKKEIERKVTEANKRRLKACRQDLAIAIIDYAEAFLGEDLNEEDFSVDSISKTLVEFEKEMESTITLTKRLKKVLDKATTVESKDPIEAKVTVVGHMSDDDIIDKFIKSLK